MRLDAQQNGARLVVAGVSMSERLADGTLLAAVGSEGFPVMIAVDRSMQLHQNLSGRKLSAIDLRVQSNDIRTLAEMVDAVSRQVPLLQPGTVVTLAHPSMG